MTTLIHTRDNLYSKFSTIEAGNDWWQDMIDTMQDPSVFSVFIDGVATDQEKYSKFKNENCSCWSFDVLDGEAGNDHIIAKRGLSLDIDGISDDQYTNMIAKLKETSIEMVIHTTLGHKLPCKGFSNRLRIMIPFEKPIDIKEWKYHKTGFEHDFENIKDLLDKTCFDQLRMFLMPVYISGYPYIFEHIKGTTYNPVKKHEGRVMMAKIHEKRENTEREMMAISKKIKGTGGMPDDGGVKLALGKLRTDYAKGNRDIAINGVLYWAAENPDYMDYERVARAVLDYVTGHDPSMTTICRNKILRHRK